MHPYSYIYYAPHRDEVLQIPSLSSFTFIRFSNITFQFHIHFRIHIYEGFRLMNLVLIIVHIHSVFKYHISIPYSLSYYLFKDILNLCTYFIYSFTYSFHILIHVYSFIYSFTYSFMCSFHILIHVYSFMCSLHILIHILIHVYSFIYSFTYSFIYSFTYSFMCSFHILIHVYSFIYPFTYTHSYTHFIYSFMYSFHILIHVFPIICYLFLVICDNNHI